MANDEWKHRCWAGCCLGLTACLAMTGLACNRAVPPSTTDSQNANLVSIHREIDAVFEPWQSGLPNRGSRFGEMFRVPPNASEGFLNLRLKFPAQTLPLRFVPSHGIRVVDLGRRLESQSFHFQPKRL